MVDEKEYIETKYFRFAEPPDYWILESGGKIGPITIAYETYGSLNENKDNAILITHAFTGDAHAAGYKKGEKKPGWWNSMIGPGSAFDTNRFFIIVSNVIGSCMGSTGPSSINPETGKPYGLSFPLVTIGDMVHLQKELIIRHFGIQKLLGVAGGSMGGMQVLEWMISYPEMIHSAIPISTTIRHSPQQIAFNEVARQSVMNDLNWNSGDYYEKDPPARGLSVARMVGHITYMSDASMQQKFGRKTKNIAAAENPLKADFEVEGYLQYRGDSFVSRFDANSFLYLTKAMDYYDASRGQPLHELLKGFEYRVMVIAFRSDWLYPAYQQMEIVRACKMAGLETTYCEIDSTYGHDAFLLETNRQSHLIHHFLEQVYIDVMQKR